MDLLQELHDWLAELWPPDGGPDRRHARKRQPRRWDWLGHPTAKTETRHTSRASTKGDASFLDRWWDWLAGETAQPGRKLPYSVKSRKYSRPADPLQRAVDWLSRRSVYTFYVRQSSGWTGPAIEALLQDHGIRIGFRGVLHGDIFFEVPAQQAGLVELLLLKANVPLTGSEPSPLSLEPKGSGQGPSH